MWSRDTDKRASIYELNVCDWRWARGRTYGPVAPLPSSNESFSPEDRPYPFFFRNPPSRADFHEVVRALPWMQIWKTNGLLDIIETSPWPILDSHHKAAETILLDAAGEQAGRVRVSRTDLWVNAAYATLPVSGSLVNTLVNRRFPQAQRNAAYQYVMDNAARIQEPLTLLDRPPEESDLKLGIVMILSEYKRSLGRPLLAR